MIPWIEHLPVLAWGPDFWILDTHIKARQAQWLPAFPVHRGAEIGEPRVSWVQCDIQRRIEKDIDANLQLLVSTYDYTYIHTSPHIIYIQHTHTHTYTKSRL